MKGRCAVLQFVAPLNLGRGKEGARYERPIDPDPELLLPGQDESWPLLLLLLQKASVKILRCHFVPPADFSFFFLQLRLFFFFLFSLIYHYPTLRFGRSFNCPAETTVRGGATTADRPRFILAAANSSLLRGTASGGFDLYLG